MADIIKRNECFAATNGFDGFKSFFNEIFDPVLFEAIYILKGGPGTGKSSIMRYIESSLSGMCENTTLVYCSSDTKSLDGVIIERGGKKIAVIDGTAPHMTDPKYPGAIEKIINLGDAWCDATLKTQRDKIIRLSNLKQRAYNSAYKYLNIARSIDENVKCITERIFSKECTDIISDVPLAINKDGFTKTSRIIEAFGSGGFYRLKPPECQKTLYVVGVYGTERLFYKHILASLEEKRASYERYPSVLNTDDSMGVMLADSKTLLINLNGSPVDESKIIDTSRFLNQSELAKEKNRLEFLWREREIMLWNSVSEFKTATNYHFELEKIYTATMNFAKIDKIKEKLLTNIKKTLNIKD